MCTRYARMCDMYASFVPLPSAILVVLPTRPRGAGDNYALALAYFQTGLPDGGFQLLQGNMLHDMSVNQPRN